MLGVLTEMRFSSATAFLVIGLAATSAAAGCSSATSTASAPTCEMKIDRFKELIVVDPSVIGDARSSNAADGPWSFRHAIEGIMPAGADPSAFVFAWLNSWIQTNEVNGFATDRESRAEGIQSTLVCPWLKRTPANHCDETCGQCDARQLDLAQAPFRLSAIVNRVDLRARPDSATPAGESRLVFSFTRGAADDPASTPGPFNIIFEYGLPDTRQPREWMEAWHALGSHPAFDEAYKHDLELLTEGFVARNAAPSKTNGSAIAQVRTNESMFDWIWQLREFRLDDSGALTLSPLANTPGEPLNGSDLLANLIRDNADKVLNDQFVLPISMRAGSADVFMTKWQFPGMDERLRAAFAHLTCHGCHSQAESSTAIIDTAFQLSPFKQGVDKLSPFLNDPADPAHDELSHRESFMRDGLCKP